MRTRGLTGLLVSLLISCATPERRLESSPARFTDLEVLEGVLLATGTAQALDELGPGALVHVVGLELPEEWPVADGRVRVLAPAEGWVRSGDPGILLAIDRVRVDGAFVQQRVEHGTARTATEMSVRHVDGCWRLVGPTIFRTDL